MSAALVKIVPHGQSVSPYSPYFTTSAQLQQVAGQCASLADCFGLPLKSEAPLYDVYQVMPKGTVTVFVSQVAPTEELGGLVRRRGGAQQYLLPNRSLWSAPVLVGTIKNRRDMDQPRLQACTAELQQLLARLASADGEVADLRSALEPLLALAGSGALATPLPGRYPRRALFHGRRLAPVRRPRAGVCALPHRGDGRRAPALRAARRGCLDRWYQLLFLGN
jgi:hypothetical protein